MGLSGFQRIQRHNNNALNRVAAPHRAKQPTVRKSPVAPPNRAAPGLLSFLSNFELNKRRHLTLVDCEEELTSWLNQQCCAVSKVSKVVAQQLDGQGRGLVAVEAVSPGELLLSIPANLVLFPEVAAAESALQPLLAQQGPRLPDWSLLVLFLAEQHYYLLQGAQHSNKGVGSASRWAAYICSLPRHPVGTVLDWKAGEVDQLLAGSGLLHLAHTILSAADLLWQELQPLIAAGQQQQLCPPDMFSKQNIFWAMSICLSRSVRLDDQDGQVVLVPFADLFNHDPSSEAYLVWEEEQQGVVLRPDKAYKPGDQVFISYGPKSNGELLLSYGFSAGDSNPHEAAQMSFSLPPGDQFFDAKQAAMTARQIPCLECFAVKIDSLPAGMLPYLAFVSAPLQCDEDAEVLATELFDKGNLPVLSSGISAEELALSTLAQHCKKALKANCFSQQQQNADRELAAVVSAGGGWLQRQAVLAAVRLRERQILSRTEFVAQQRLRQLRKGSR
eukprot:gene13031-13160_t